MENIEHCIRVYLDNLYTEVNNRMQDPNYFNTVASEQDFSKYRNLKNLFRNLSTEVSNKMFEMIDKKID